MLHSERGLSIGGLPDICSRGRGKRSSPWFGKGLLEDQHEGSREKARAFPVERADIRLGEQVRDAKGSGDDHGQAMLFQPRRRQHEKSILADAIKKEGEIQAEDAERFIPPNREEDPVQLHYSRLHCRSFRSGGR